MAVQLFELRRSNPANSWVVEGAERFEKDMFSGPVTISIAMVQNSVPTLCIIKKYLFRPVAYKYYHGSIAMYHSLSLLSLPISNYKNSILVVEPFKTRSFPIKTRVIWVPGKYCHGSPRTEFKISNLWWGIKKIYQPLSNLCQGKSLREMVNWHSVTEPFGAQIGRSASKVRFVAPKIQHSSGRYSWNAIIYVFRGQKTDHQINVLKPKKKHYFEVILFHQYFQWTIFLMVFVWLPGMNY